jgi:hypothetical protein
MFPASSNGGGMCTLPGPIDVCKIPAPPAPFAPAPFPNIAQLTQAKGSSCSSKVKILNKKTATKKTEISRSQGDEAGTLKGMKSMVNMDKCNRKISFAKVKVEGDEIVTVMKMTAHNGTNCNAPPGQQVAPSQTKVICMG